MSEGKSLGFWCSNPACPLTPKPPRGIPAPYARRQKIMRVAQGEAIPVGWELVEWLGTETGPLWSPSFKADVVLAQEAEAAT